MEETQVESKEQEWRWALVANIKKAPHPYGPEHELRYGTKNFLAGAKVYCGRSMWGDGYDRIAVIGAQRQSHGRKYRSVIMKRCMVENFRIQKVYKKSVLQVMEDSYYSWWGNTDKDRYEILGYLEWLTGEKEYEDIGLVRKGKQNNSPG